jgi:ABC-type branched-subunit amino acid transport system substrate-binding protein
VNPDHLEMMKLKNRSLLATILLALILLVGCTGHVVKDNQLKVGAIIPLTGWGAYYGVPELKGMQLALEDSELIVEDSKGLAKEAINAANKLLNIDDVDVVVVSFAPPSSAVAPFLEANKVPFIYDAYIKSPLENNYAFKSNFDPEEGCKNLAQFSGATKTAAILANIEYGHVCLEGARTVKPVDEFFYEFGETDFRTLLLKVKDYEDVLVIGWENEFKNLFKQKAELGLDFRVLCATASECISPDQAHSEILAGTVGIDFLPVAESFELKYVEKYGKTPNSELIFAAHGFDAIKIIEKAAEGCFTSDCILNNLKTVKDYESGLNTNGFENRVLQIETGLYEFDEEWELLLA